MFTKRYHKNILLLFVINLFACATSFAVDPVQKDTQPEVTVAKEQKCTSITEYQFQENGITYSIRPLSYLKPSWKTLWKTPVAVEISSNKKNIEVNTHNLFKNISLIQDTKLVAQGYAAGGYIGSLMSSGILATITHKFRYYIENYSLTALLSGEPIKMPSLKNMIIGHVIIAPIAIASAGYIGHRIGAKLGGEKSTAQINKEQSFWSYSHFISQRDLKKLEEGIDPKLNYKEVK